MLRTILMASAVAVCAATSAFAASPGAPQWGGFYAGVNAGFGGDQVKYPGSGTFTPSGGVAEPFSGTVSQTSSGFLGGGQVGYNYQAQGGWIVGLETDIDGTGIKGKTALSGSGSNPATGGTGSISGSVSSNIDYLGTVRVRAGLPIADGRFVPYVSGGLAYGQVTSKVAYSATSSALMATDPSGSASRGSTRTGWTVGAGADYALSDRLSFRAEYLYADLGTKTALAGSATNLLGTGDAISGTIGVTATANIVRVGLNYRFGG